MKHTKVKQEVANGSKKVPLQPLFHLYLVFFNFVQVFQTSRNLEFRSQKQPAISNFAFFKFTVCKFTSGNNNTRFAGGAMFLNSSHLLANSGSLNSDNGLSMHQRVGRIIYWGSARKKIKLNVPILSNLGLLVEQGAR